MGMIAKAVKIANLDFALKIYAMETIWMGRIVASIGTVKVWFAFLTDVESTIMNWFLLNSQLLFLRMEETVLKIKIVNLTTARMECAMEIWKILNNAF